MKPLIDAGLEEIPGYDLYLVDREGRVWSNFSSSYLTPYTGPNGYPYVTMVHGREYVHRLVALTFLPVPPDGVYEVNHIDFNRSNCNVENLEWVKRRDNLRHAHTKQDRKKVTSYRHPNCKLSDEDVIEIRLSVLPERYLAKMYGVSARTIGHIRKGERYQWVQGGN